MRRLFLFAASHLPLLIGYVVAYCIPFSPIAVLILPSLVLLYPGLMVVRQPERLHLSYWVIVFGTSNGLLVGGLIVARVFGLYLHAYLLWMFLCAITWIGWLLHPLQQERLYGTLVRASVKLESGKKALIIVGFVLTYVSALWIVPPQQDQDMVIVNPTYGYLQYGKPYGTETHFSYIFSKPPLLHLQAGFTLLLLDQLEAAHFYWQSGKIVGLLDEAHWATRRFRQRDIESFDLNPELVTATRMTTILYGTFLPVLLANLALALGASSGVALGAGFVFAAIPEVFIRAGYAGFTTPSNVLLVVAALLLMRNPGRKFPLFLVAVMIALVNQKALLVPAAYAASLLVPPSSTRARLVAKNPWLWGAIVGTTIWWLYGAAVDWQTFLRDHLYYDFRDRFLLQDMPLGLSSETWYPGVFGLWIEWARNVSPPLLLLGMAGVVWGLFRNESCRFLAFWAILGWVLSSITDWRQTKHLMLTIVPMAALGILLVSRLKSPIRQIMIGLCLASGVYNVLRIIRLWHDFDSLPPSTVW